MDPIRVTSVDELNSAATKLLDACKHERFFAFYGEMGAGKTTFIKHICQHLGVEGEVSSPTFAVVNEYAGGKPIFHIDAYRLKNLEEALDIGLEEYFEQDAYCLVEWPEIIETILPENTVKVTISRDGTTDRVISLVS